MSNSFNVGDRVQLNSGGPIMTVEEVDDPDFISCIWFNDKGEVQRQGFPPAVLKKSLTRSPSDSRAPDHLSEALSFSGLA